MDKNLVHVKVINSLIFSTFAILLPHLPLLLLERKFQPDQVGSLLMIGPFFAILVQPIVGYISDRFHSLKVVLILLWFLTGISTAGLFMIDNKSASLLFVITLFMFFLSAIPLIETLSVQTAEQNHVPYSSIRLWGSLGFCVVSILLGSYFHALGGLQALLNIYIPIWMAACILLFMLKGTTLGGIHQEKLNIKDVACLVKDKKIAVFLFFVLFLAVPHRMNDALFSLYYKELGATENLISWAWAVVGCSEIVGFYFSARFIQKVSSLKLITTACFLYLVRWIGHVFISDPSWILILQILQAGTYSLFWVAAVNYMASAAPKRLGASSQALLAMVFLGVSGLIGGSVGGTILQIHGGSAMYTFAVGLTVVALLGFISIKEVRS